MTVLVGVLGGILTYRHIFIGTGILLILSNILYAFAGVANSKWLIFVARIGLGLGAGTLGTVRAYFAEAYDEANRTTALAVTAAVQYAGFALFPGVGDLIAFLCDKFGWHKPLFDENTAPAWIMAALSLTSVIALLWSFHEPAHKKFELSDLLPIYKPWIYKQTRQVGKSIRRAFGLQTSAEVARDKIHFDPTASSTFELTTFSGHGLNSTDSLPPPSPAAPRVPGKEDATNNGNGTNNGGSSTSNGNSHPNNDDSEHSDHHHTSPYNSGDNFSSDENIDLDTTLNHDSDYDDDDDDGPAERRGIDLEAGPPTPTGETSKKTLRLITYIWISFLILNFLIRVALGTVEVLGSQLYEGVTAKYLTPPDTEFNPSSGTFYMILGIVGTGITLIFAIFAKKIDDQIPFFLSLGALFVGSFTLIGKLTTMSLPRFTFALGLIYSVGYPLAQSVVVSMFSKIPASQRSQAVSMSWIGSVGSVGRILGPIAVGAIYHKGGAVTTFIFNTAVTALTLALAIVTVYFMKKIK